MSNKYNYFIVGEDLSFPKGFIFSKEDWKDLYQTLKAFKARVYIRRNLNGPPIRLNTRKYQKNLPK